MPFTKDLLDVKIQNRGRKNQHLEDMRDWVRNQLPTLYTESQAKKKGSERKANVIAHKQNIAALIAKRATVPKKKGKGKEREKKSLLQQILERPKSTKELEQEKAERKETGIVTFDTKALQKKRGLSDKDLTKINQLRGNRKGHEMREVEKTMNYDKASGVLHVPSSVFKEQKSRSESSPMARAAPKMERSGGVKKGGKGGKKKGGFKKKK
ncbi:hypothetical protein PROFUN_05224 [Planoprotostelium fungivorum]|uniref:Ribosome biogenesis regulatory protein n=1 Tax=Planoprotostelium fungivorum TaxID=1890364 RepID=A0A2P6NRL0_9EUKA|nr:hypothetical protein PROFUN_05224 [Planoprotostelium fungivorum]